MNKRSAEFWVGVFIFTGLFIVAYMTIRLGSYDQHRNSYDLTVSFKYTNGVMVGAPVRVAGVEVGKVKELVLTPDAETKVDVVVSLEESVKIRRNVVIQINSLGIMGEKYIEFLPQESESEIIPPGERVIGIDPVSLADITSNAQGLISGLKGMFENEKGESQFGTVLGNLAEITGKENQENLSATLANFKEFSSNMKTVGTDLEEVSKDKKISETMTNFHQASLSFKSAMGEVEKGEGTLGKLIYDPELYDKLNQFIMDLMDNPSQLFRPSKDKRKGSGSFLFFNQKDEK